MAATKGKRAVGYLRVSTAREDMQADEMYRQQIVAAAKAKGLKLGRTYADLDYSGRNGSRTRPAFEEMLAAAAQGAFDVLILPKLSRFGRSAKENLNLFDQLEADGITFLFLDLDVDTSKSFGRMMRTMLSGMAEFESDRISESWKETHRHLALKGQPHAKAPFGYRYSTKTKRYSIDRGKAAIVRDLFTRYAQGETVGALVRRHGGAVKRSSVVDMLANVVYTGYREADGELVQGTWTPLIDAELFEAVQARRVAARGAGQVSRSDSGALLAGLLRCGTCGNTMSRNGPVYACSKRTDGCRGGSISSMKAERDVSEAFVDRVRTDYARRAAKAKSTLRSELARTGGADTDIEAALRAVDAKLDRAAAAAVDDATSPVVSASFLKKAAKLEAERDALAQQVAARRVADADGDRDREAFDALMAQVADIEATLAAAEPDERRRMLGLVIDRVDVVPDGGEGHTSRKAVQVAWR